MSVNVGNYMSKSWRESIGYCVQVPSGILIIPLSAQCLQSLFGQVSFSANSKNLILF